MKKLQTVVITTVAALSTGIASAQSSSSVKGDPAAHLNNNKCFVQLKDNDQVIITAAFHSGTEGFSDLKLLLSRKPWGAVVSPVLREELDKLEKEASPFLTLTLSKKQALILEEHRDLIKWILVQSTTKPCT